MLRAPKLVLPLVATLALLGANAAAAPCSSLDNPVYLQIGSTMLPVVRALARELRDSQVKPMTLVFVDGRSCAIIDAVSNDTKLVTNASYVPSSAEDANWTPNDPPLTCTIDAPGVSIDLGHSDVFVDSCTAAPLPAGVIALTGPVLPFVFVVPQTSSQRAITAEEAYFVWGFGSAGQITPWNDEALLFSRPNTSGTKITFGANIGVPANRWKGQQLNKTSDVVNAVVGAANAEAALGIVGGTAYDANRDKLKALAFRAFEQNYAYYADSTATSFDKRNVRDGHYLLWGPAIFLARSDSSGKPQDERVAYLLDLLLSRPTQPAADFDANAVLIDEGLIPSCAMKVSRTSQGGDLASFLPERSCNCFFEQRVSGSTSCKACKDDAQCSDQPGTSCNFGYCE